MAASAWMTSTWPLSYALRPPGDLLERPMISVTPGRGRLNDTHVPTPTSLSAQISPPCNSTSCLLMDRPRPLPLSAARSAGEN